MRGRSAQDLRTGQSPSEANCHYKLGQSEIDIRNTNCSRIASLDSFLGGD